MTDHRFNAFSKSCVGCGIELDVVRDSAAKRLVGCPAHYVDFDDPNSGGRIMAVAFGGNVKFAMGGGAVILCVSDADLASVTAWIERD